MLTHGGSESARSRDRQGVDKRENYSGDMSASDQSSGSAIML
jgi:hypothetical protein